MTEVFLGQIMLTGFTFAPKGFALCNGQLLSISQNQALFSLLGTYYGGDGVTSFALPDLRGRTTVGFGQSVDAAWYPPPYQIGEAGGAENVTLTAAQLPPHNHACCGTTTAGAQRSPNNALYGTTTELLYAPMGGAQVALSPVTVAPVGGNQPHLNMQPFDVISYCIALSGVFPSRN